MVDIFMYYISQVSICDINEDVGVKLADLLGAKFGNVKVIFCPCDVTDYPQFQGKNLQ